MSDESKIINKLVRESHLDFLFEQHERGVYVGEENLELLRKHNYIHDLTKKAREKAVRDAIMKLPVRNTPNGRQADAQIDIIEEDGSQQHSEKLIDIITDDDLEDRRKRYGHRFIGRDKPILSHEWKPESTTEHTQEFIDWINSINKKGFRNRISYKPFTLYCQQAYLWLAENGSYTEFEDEDERLAFMMEELRRCDENALYFLNKYVFYKEGDDESGKIKYIAAPAHEFLAFLDDAGYSVGLAKGRQMAATTTLMALDVRDVIFKTNHFMKFITEDVVKAEEIIEDKLKFAFAELPWWMTPDVLNERDNMFKMGFKQDKGRKEGVGSKIQVVAPKRTAIAGGAPQKVKIDEAGNIPILGVMIGNARPTMMYYDPKTGKLRLKRRLWFWGTGGEMEKGGKAFETELMTIMKQWDDGNYDAAIIPIFLDWTCRPGASQEDYDREKRMAYAKGDNPQDPDAKKHITEFHQTWPTSISDVFRTSAKTLVDEDYIENALARIRDAKAKSKIEFHQSGYFEPVYDYNQPTIEGSDVDYKIIDSVFVPTTDLDKRATVTIFLHPESGWENRYWQGTDPIDTDTGLSNMASAIWDKEFKCPVAILNWRTRDYRQVFMQTLLLGIYYDTRTIKKGVKELVEANRGTSYTEYKKNKGYGDEMVLNYQLPINFQNKTTINESVGIDNKGIRNTMIIDRMHDLIELYGDRICLEIFFQQLKTFTCKISDHGKEVWGTINKKYFKDDVLFSMAFAYICSELCFPELPPKNISELKNKFVIKWQTVRGSDNKLRKVQVRVPIAA